MQKLRLKLFKRKRGMGLIVILAMTGVLVILTAAVGGSAVQDLNAMSRQTLNDQAHYAAYSGIQYALSQLNIDPRISSDLSGNNYQSPFGIGFPNPALSSVVSVYSNLSAALYPTNVGPDGVAIPPGSVYITSQSTFAGKTSTGSETITNFATPNLLDFKNAVFGSLGIYAQDAVVNCFDSGTLPVPAAYPIAPTPPPSYANYTVVTPAVAPNGQANLATNSNSTSTSNPAIGLGPNTEVDGSLLSGPGSVASSIQVAPAPTIYSGAEQVLGTSLAQANVAKPASPDGTWTNLDIGPGSTFTGFSPGGVYLVNGTLTMEPNSKIVISSTPLTDKPNYNVFVYVTQGITIKDHCTINGNTAGVPSTMQFFVEDQQNPATPGPANGFFNMTGPSSTGNFVVAGKDLNASLTNGAEIYGAINAQNVTLQGGGTPDAPCQIHYDLELLKKVSSLGPPQWSIGAWGSGSNGMGGGVIIPPGPGPGPGPGPSTTSTSTSTASTTATTTATTATTITTIGSTMGTELP